MAGRSFARGVAGIMVFFVVSVFLVTKVHAATTNTTANGLKVSPVTTNLTVSAGQSATVDIYVQNVTTQTVALQAIVNDFTAASDESGAPALLLDNEYAPAHSLKRYVAPIGDFTLGPGQQKTVTVHIAIPANAPGGGYYGAVRFAPASTTPGSSNVTLSASVGSLILVRVPGAVKEQLVLDSFDVRDVSANVPRNIFITNQNLEVVARFENTGDVQEQPFGKVLLKQGNTQLASYELNDTTPRGNVLPNSVRRFTVDLDKVGFFGQFTVVGNFGYGNSGQLLSAQTTFYVIPLAAILITLAVIALILFLVFGAPRLVRAYNRRIIERATRRP